MTDFWFASGHHLLDHDEHGRLVVTGDFVKAYLARPEIVPPDDACLVERAVHARLLREPRALVAAAEIADMADADARENWRHLVAFRAALLGYPTLEAAWLAIIRARQVTVPPLFLNQLVHVILRNILDGETDAFRLRAAELLFRQQRLSSRDGMLLLADAETVESRAEHDRHAPLVAMFADADTRDCDILTLANAPDYARRSDAHDMVLDFRAGEAARLAFARVLEAWVRHLLGVVVHIEAVAAVADDDWSWFVGLDEEGTRIGNALWRGEEPAGDGRARIVALFRLAFADPREMLAEVAGKPVYLILGMTPGRVVRVKPQNLVAHLPIRSSASVN